MRMNNKTSDIKDIINILSHKNYKLIGVDGQDGVGKTSIIAKNIHKALGIKTFSIDKYLIPKQDKYVEALNLEKLLKDIQKEINKKTILIEGVMLLEVLNKIKIKHDYLIYCSDNSWVFQWEEFGIFNNKRLEEIIEHEENLINRIKRITDPNVESYKMTGFRREYYEYSFDFKPFLKADIIYIDK